MMPCGSTERGIPSQKSFVYSLLRCQNFRVFRRPLSAGLNPFRSVPIAGQPFGIPFRLGVAWATSATPAYARLRPRMRLRVNFLEPRHAHVGVNLRRR